MSIYFLLVVIYCMVINGHALEVLGFVRSLDWYRRQSLAIGNLTP